MLPSGGEDTLIASISRDFSRYSGSCQYMKRAFCVLSLLGQNPDEAFQFLGGGGDWVFGNTYDRWQNKLMILQCPNCSVLPICPFFQPVLCRYIQSERSIILVNFCLSILASNLLILVGQSQTLSKVRQQTARMIAVTLLNTKPFIIALNSAYDSLSRELEVAADIFGTCWWLKVPWLHCFWSVLIKTNRDPKQC